MPKTSEPPTCAIASGSDTARAPETTVSAMTPSITSTPPTKPVAAKPAGPRLSRRLPSSALWPQISSGSRPVIRG
jgi:hypothetical protein